MADQPGRPISATEFDAFLDRNTEFHQRVVEIVADLEPYPDQRFVLAMKSAHLSLEHGAAVALLVSADMCAPGFTLVRTQFESLVRGIWLLYAATDTWVEKLSQPLTQESADMAKDTLMLADMLKRLRASEGAPAGLLDQLEACRDVTWKALNSYAHGGFHPLSRLETGYPAQLAYDVLRNSNAVTALATQLTAILTGDQRAMAPVRSLHVEFADCLPIINP
ncbi:hypothetical protein G3580_09380 [Nitrogeniibacter mangrovi]|uniref:Uncharacterized protein n=1 Tax=Nitrogeniibacter mangrovi TaxID=2016596 RepID=A0A6C1B370_9RHOO|nr:hypothetical protein [Nitrogeniibacter mangrovi]QID17833.1 hypothetical protein G3580_09380 [Nitrogeniibacter mangrovi]